jgi:hypothetical protein
MFPAACHDLSEAWDAVQAPPLSLRSDNGAPYSPPSLKPETDFKLYDSNLLCKGIFPALIDETFVLRGILMFATVTRRVF